MNFNRVSEKRQKNYLIPVWGGRVACLMADCVDKYGIVCDVCGKIATSYYSFTTCDDEQVEVIVGKGCFKKCKRIE